MCPPYRYELAVERDEQRVQRSYGSRTEQTLSQYIDQDDAARQEGVFILKPQGRERLPNDCSLSKDSAAKKEAVINHGV